MQILFLAYKKKIKAYKSPGLILFILLKTFKLLTIIPNTINGDIGNNSWVKDITVVIAAIAEWRITIMTSFIKY